MMNRTRTLDFLTVSSLLVLALGAELACSGNDEGTAKDSSATSTVERPEIGETGAICETASDCFADVMVGSLAGDAVCLDRVDDGYCSHECEVDTDCCAADGECKNSFSQVCSPFESTGLNLCLLSCEAEDLEAAQDLDSPPEDASAFCQQGAGSDFICRSSGGGKTNRKVCVPGDCGVGADCVDDSDCTGDLSCLFDYKSGYCGKADCTNDADCPGDSVCAAEGNGSICLKKCTVASDCSFCRHGAAQVDCADDVPLMDGSLATVCTPQRIAEE